MDLQALAALLEASALGMWMRAGWAYPLVNVAHLAGMALLIGPILLLDLRLLGFGARFNAEDVSRALTPFAITGLLVATVTGIALFSADARALIGNGLMQLKMLAVVLSVINAILFRAFFARDLVRWDDATRFGAKAIAAMSILMWFAVLAAGRMIAYV